MEKEFPKRKCELCNSQYSNVIDVGDTIFTLCPNHTIDLIMLSLKTKDAKILLKAHGSETFYLHEDFYDEKGHALQPNY
jgi:hypothetical protein